MHKNKRTINEVCKLRNNKKNIKKLGTKDLGPRGTVLGMGIKIKKIKQVTSQEQN